MLFSPKRQTFGHMRVDIQVIISWPAGEGKTQPPMISMSVKTRYNLHWISRMRRERFVKAKDLLAKLENTRLIFAHHRQDLD